MKTLKLWIKWFEIIVRSYQFYGCFGHETCVNEDCFKIAEIKAKTTSHRHSWGNIDQVQQRSRFVHSQHSKCVWFICLLIQIHKLRKILIILTNDSSDSNHSSTFTILVVVAFIKKEESKRQRHQAMQTHNKIVWVCLRITLILCFVYMSIRVVAVV